MRYFSSFCFVLAIILFAGCSKKGSSTPPPPPADNDAIGLSTGTLARVILIDQSATKYKYIWIEPQGTYVYRSDVDKTFSLTQLATDKDCKWKIQRADNTVAAAGSGTGGSSLDKEEVIFRSAKNDVQYWGVSKGGTVSGNEEWRLSNFRFDTKPSPVPDYIRFILHKQTDRNGVHAYTIESKFKPGFYLMNTGHNIVAIGVAVLDANQTNTPPAIFEFH